MLLQRSSPGLRAGGQGSFLEEVLALFIRESGFFSLLFYIHLGPVLLAVAPHHLVASQQRSQLHSSYLTTALQESRLLWLSTRHYLDRSPKP